ncbi:MAG: hypothetical protein AB1428_12985 [Bacteroidota bacterium]
MRERPDRFSSNAAQAQRTARHLSDFIQTNLHHLRKVDRTGKLEKDAASFHARLQRGEELTGNQLSYLEALYEKTMAGAGFPSVDTHHDKRPRSLKFG